MSALPNNFNYRLLDGSQMTNTVIKANGGGEISTYVTDITTYSGGTIRTWQLLDGSGGTVLWQITTVANTLYNIQLKTPLKVTKGKDLCCTNGGTSTNATIIVHGFQAKG